MEFSVKNKTLGMTIKMHLALFSLAKTFLRSYHVISAIFVDWKRYNPNFFGYKFIIHQSFYLGKYDIKW